MLIKKRVLGNFMIAFLSPLIGSSLALNIDFLEGNWKLLGGALISASIVTGMVIAREWEKTTESKS